MLILYEYQNADTDCIITILKILVGNDLGSEVYNTAPDVATVGLTSILHSFPSGLSSDSSARVLFLICSSLSFSSSSSVYARTTFFLLQFDDTYVTA